MGVSTAPEDPVAALLDLVAKGQGSKESIHQICSLTLTLALEDRPDVAQSYIDAVNRVSVDSLLLPCLTSMKTMDTVPLDNESFRKCLRALRKVCGKTGLLPSPYMLSTGVEKQSGLASARGGNADVFIGTYNGSRVAIKELRTVLNNNERSVKKVKL